MGGFFIQGGKNFMCAWMNKIIALCVVFIFACSGSGMAQLPQEDQHFINPEYSKKISMDFKDAS